MYGFDAGHWVYVNPKATYIAAVKDTVTQVKIGGGLMTEDDTATWVQANIYF